MAPDHIKILLDILTQFTGGRGGIDNIVVNYGIAGIFYIVLFTISRKNYRENKQSREYMLQWGFGFGLSRELFMLLMAMIHALGWVDPVKLHTIFPPLEHFLYDNAMIFIACGYMRFFVDQANIAHRYLQLGIVSNLLVYLASFWWWADFIQANPTSKFGKVWCDWLFHSNGSFWLLIATLYIFSRSRLKTRNMVTLALFLFIVSDFLKIPDMALDEVYEYVFTPIARLNYLAGIFILGYVYFQEFSIERKSIEQQLKKSELMLKTIVDHSIDGIAVANLETLRFSLFNPACSQMLGYSEEEFSKLTIPELHHVDDLPRIKTELENLKQGNAGLILELPFKRKDGSRILMDDSASLLEVDGKPHVMGIFRDVTERKRAEEKLRLTSQLFETTLESIIITDANRALVDVNQAFTQITGYTRTEVLGKNPGFLKSGHQDEAFYASMWQTINNSGHWSGELWNRRKDGVVYPELITISAIKNDKGIVTHYVGISSDITLQKQHEKQLEHIAHYDELTGIPNRILLIDRMHQSQAQTRREQNLLAVCYLDLDGFKPINDTFGHEAGDKVLVEIAKRIGHALRGGDTVARLGGDEFVILLLGLDDAYECNRSLDRLLNVIAQPISHDGGQAYTVTASIGATLFPNDDQDSDTLLRHADQAMYLAKQLGKNRYSIFDPSKEIQTKIQYEQLLRIEQGFQNNEFELFYQPKIELCSYKVLGMEALIRWRHPEHGVLSPDQFMSIIENSPLENFCGEWVIKTALKQLEHWIKEELTLQVGINVSANHLLSPLFVVKLQQILTQYPDVPAELLQIEILETAALADIPTAARIIEECAEFGVSFGLDDFGTGYSSLSYLRRLPAETLKIDLSFVRDMLINKDDHAIVKGVISLGHSFNRITVAEGVETLKHFEILRDMGCDIGQGFWIARPMPAEEVVSWCEAYSGNTKNVINKATNSEIKYREILWNSKFEIGHERIDFEHRIFLGLIIEVNKEAYGRCDHQRIKRLLHVLTEYARFHFVSEENIMEEIDYPELESHRVLHRRLLSRLSDIAYDVNQQRADYFALVDFLFEWFTTHTTTEDKKISIFIAGGLKRE
ncbi:EAL domain-containing protein [Methylomonas sp. AM2-LC]|uniref:EAL domain-containing protein n=1 Tax=Methylomonas sp. AM2-LC TaxID=3153301 RepID=UPI003266FB1E